MTNNTESESLLGRKSLVELLAQRGLIRSDRVRDAFLSVPRELFIPAVAAEKGIAAVYKDEAYPARVDAQGRWLSSSSQPAIMAVMLEALELAPGLRILEIGAGTGYNAALLAQMVAPTGSVLTLDIDPVLARQAARALRRVRARVEVFTGDGLIGYPAAQPFDRIVVTATPPLLPVAWRDQLQEGGVLVAPLTFARHKWPNLVWKLRREEATFQVLDAYHGGFMPFRQAAGYGTDQVPPGVSASGRSGISVVAGSVPMLSVSGFSIMGLKVVALRRLAHLLTGAARRRRLVRRLEPSLAIRLVVGLERVPHALIAAGTRWQDSGVLFFNRTATAAAALTLGGHLLGYGGQEVEGLVETTVERWEASGRPKLRDLDARLTWSNPRGGLSVALDDECRLVLRGADLDRRL